MTELPSPHRPWPRLGALAVVVHDDRVLLVRRRKDPDAGLWGFPGGHVEAGETVLTAAARELAEETGVTATPQGYLTNIDLLRHGARGEILVHYLLVGVLCVYRTGSPVAADDALDARWFDVAAIRTRSVAMSEHVVELMELALTGAYTRLDNSAP
ncbi:NUDIX hydrolase [Chachezhania sediminis]|uniref:NUDIX hydrolase n=1 Tax=Chachezhania sediminis TaxID=2599291 RepID=UPI00131B1513|nr:NUDIX hydrolase [Chachezhania sediminis]